MLFWQEMNGALIVSILAILFLTYQLIMILRNKETPKQNRRLAWFIYSFVVIALVIVNIFLLL